MEKMELAEEVRALCIKTFNEHFQEALISGLCTEGALEVAIGAVNALDLKALVD